MIRCTRCMVAFDKLGGKKGGGCFLSHVLSNHSLVCVFKQMTFQSQRTEREKRKKGLHRKYNKYEMHTHEF